MDNTKDKNSKLIGSPNEMKMKAPYFAPQILSREFLEAVAAVCPAPNGKAQGQGGCTIPSS